MSLTDSNPTSGLATTSTLLPSMDTTVGAFALGTFVSLMLYGICVHQFYSYVRHFPSDDWIIKGLVVGVMVWETLHAIAPMHACYHYLVDNYDSADALRYGVWSLDVTPAFGAVILVLAECFFVRRVSLSMHSFRCHSLCKKLTPTLQLEPGRDWSQPSQSCASWQAVCRLVHRLAIVHFSTAVVSAEHVRYCIAIAAKAFHLRDFVSFDAEAKVQTILSLALNAIGDCLLAGSIIAGLYRNRASHTRSSALAVAELYVLNTGLLVGVLQTIAAILAICYPLRLYWAAVGLNAVRMYGITLLSVLNSRTLLLSRGVTIFTDGTGASTRNILSRAQRLNTVERWNVPNDPNDSIPPIINVKVAAEIEVHGQSDTDLSGDYARKAIAQP
ncbi:hypothetical protein NUW54_g4382 [Trametes sanguinea]|uniref:Uncharacterized protein n=1 Tax=Trametes sanguinea TaxID=158606 RepID=A0ACC1Q075_9APHY|nr:hypothetical protein NUW54_g4382 [Trametes sanguinea]